MADTKVQNPTSESRRDIARREPYYPSRDVFNFSPFSMMRRLSEEMDRAFSSSFGLGRWFGEAGAWSPAVEVRERNGNLEILAELPGMTKDDVKVECTDEGIILQGEKRSEHKTEEGGYHRTERSYGQFYRVIPLPQGADANKAKAEFKNGVLEVRVPLSEQQRSGRQIPITS
jgi:HSP20 family protein